ncbi:MAG TPA: glycoside hydrolase family 15 protein [Phycisphaerae bacterium]|nr:glycoside hydrolase family 15 protein [Phycisphaerae bacterium]
MPRDVPVGNGNLLVSFDGSYRIRDLYFPHVGQENHNQGSVCRFGVWCDGRFSWMGPEWAIRLDYEPETLVTHVTCTHEDLQVQLECADCVDFHENVYLRRVTVSNLADQDREVRLFFSHDFNLYGTKVGDTAFYDPETRSIIHYKARRYLLVNCADPLRWGVEEFTCGTKEVRGLEGTWRDAEDGLLEGHAVAQGTVDSTIGVRLNLAASGQAVLYYWIAGGRVYHDVRRINQTVLAKTPQAMIARTRDYWRLWVNKEEFNFEGVPEEVVWLFKRSQLILRTQIDNDGAILAANDSDIVHISRDTYSYCWPRDGALAAYALIKAGHSGISRRFFEFCSKIIHADGYFLHKYNPDGSLASSWHPWISDAAPRLPIQEDETALVIWAFWRHFQKFRDIEFVARFYRPMLMKAADFLAQHVDPETGLPLPSHDLWEERWGVHTWTVATVIAGLQAAARFAAAFGESPLASRYERVAQRMREALTEHFWNEAEGRFARSGTRTPGGYELDMTVDASLCGLVLFGILGTADDRVTRTLQAIRDRLTVRTDVGGIARYEGDTWHRVVDDPVRVPGNPWFITGLWMMRCEIVQARTVEELEKSFEWMRWVAKWCLPSGVLAEQLHPETGEPMGVSPLAWSHAEVVSTLVEYLEKRCCLVEQTGRIQHIHQRGRYADRYMAPHFWEQAATDGDPEPPPAAPAALPPPV